MRSQYFVRIHKNGYQNAAILKMVAKHNEGVEPFSISDFLSFQSIHRALDNDTEKNFCIERDETDDSTFRVSEDGGKTFTLTIRKVTIHSLKEMADEFGEKYNSDI